MNIGNYSQYLEIMKEKMNRILSELDEAIMFFVLDNHENNRISMPDYFIDIFLSHLGQSLNIKFKKSNDMTYRGINIIPSYENKIVVFNLDSPVSKRFKVIEL